MLILLDKVSLAEIYQYSAVFNTGSRYIYIKGYSSLPSANIRDREIIS